jgi:hypothetical protein
MLYFGEPSTINLIEDEKYENNLKSLPHDDTPGPNDVACARGKSYWDHEGNKMYRHLIVNATGKYSTTRSKLEKSFVVSEILDAVDKRNGKFVKKERKDGPWVEVDKIFAREKVGQSLRDGLSNNYRSSTMAKKQRRTQANKKATGAIDRVIHSNASVSQRIDELNLEVQKKGSHASDFSLMTLFSRANSDILEIIKKDARLLDQFQDATAVAADFGAI